jgi:tetratricopeptide (TPR) repeat protein
MRFQFLLFLLVFWVNSAHAQTYSIIDGRAIKLFQEGKQFSATRNYEEALSNYKAAIAREASFLEAYVEAAQVLMTLGRLEEAEKIALLGKTKLSGKNAKPKNKSDYGWLFCNLYLKQGKFSEAYQQFLEVEPNLDESFRNSIYYKQMKSRMDFLWTQL